jgi:hypothetical protein
VPRRPRPIGVAHDHGERIRLGHHTR